MNLADLGMMFGGGVGSGKVHAVPQYDAYGGGGLGGMFGRMAQPGNGRVHAVGQYDSGGLGDLYGRLFGRRGSSGVGSAIGGAMGQQGQQSWGGLGSMGSMFGGGQQQGPQTLASLLSFYGRGY